MPEAEVGAGRGGRALAALAVLTLLWGYTWVITKQVLVYAGPFLVGALRSGTGALALLAVLFLMRRSVRPVAVGKIACIGIFQSGGFIALSTWALVEGGVGKTTVLIYTMPIWTLLLGRLILGERIRGSQWLAVIAALSGLAFIIAPWNMHTSLFSKLLAVLAALCWALATVLVKRWRNDLSADLLALTTWQLVFGALLLAIVALAVPEQPARWSPAFAGLIIFMALASTALGWYLWLYVLERLPAWQASLSILGIPAVAILSSRWQLDEAVEPVELMGMALIGLGLLTMSLLNWHGQRRLQNTP